MVVLPEGLRERIAEEGVVTHYGTDLDQVVALEALRRWAGVEKLKVDRTPAGVPVEGRVNVDVGDSRAVEGITVSGSTVVIDHHFNGYDNTLEVLRDAGVYVPAQAVELADRLDHVVSPLEWRTGLSLVRYLPPEKVWELAEAGLLAERLSDEQLARYGLVDAAARQKAVVDAAVEAVRAGAVSSDAVVVEGQVAGGAAVAYELGYRYYASVARHPSGSGSTFAVAAAPGQRLPGGVLRYCAELRDLHGSGVYVAPSGGMVVAGGPKNPDFSLPVAVEELKRQLGGLLAGPAEEKLRTAERLSARLSGSGVSL